MSHIPRKRFGQNFLVDDRVIADILAAVSPQYTDSMVEIGPGLGALTRPLVAKLRHLHVIEIDRDIVAQLRQDFPPERLTVHEGDVLKFEFSALAPDLRVVGNLPYNISTPVLFRLAQAARHLRDIHVMLQREVVERAVARPSTSQYGRLSVMLQYRFQLEQLFNVPAAAFRPAPRVQSAMMRLRPLQQEPAADEALLATLVASGFAQRRKMLRNALGDFLDEGDFSALGIDPRRRAQDLATADFVRAANYLSRKKAA